jgi:tellurite resistance protein
MTTRDYLADVAGFLKLRKVERLRKEHGFSEAFSDEAPSEGAMSPRGAIYAAAYFVALADGQATDDELAIIARALDALAPRTVPLGKDATEQVQIKADVGWARSASDELFARIAAALPSHRERTLALLVATHVLYADGEIHDAEANLIKQLGTALSLDDATIASVVERARSND